MKEDRDEKVKGDFQERNAELIQEVEQLREKHQKKQEITEKKKNTWEAKRQQKANEKDAFKQLREAQLKEKAVADEKAQKKKIYRVDQDLPEASKQLQRQMQREINEGKQNRLENQMSTLKPISKEELTRQKRNLADREKRRLGKHAKNFYMLDTETSGFIKHGAKNEPIQIVALLYRNGIESQKESFQRYYMPRGIISESALNTHGLSKEILEEKGAHEFTLGQSQLLANFLNIELSLIHI